ncbi:Sapep family Mn(2+)-dependent dipeptidase [Ventrimonas sp. CLA-AP-H27]|uniref:Sapep family Mn(2+)-dependent dipeptidase n=1 Tax=Ventrimonas faecis TaxID=3133170 RepID=A0ABV1HK72_9FIRM
MYKPDESFKQTIDQWIEANQEDFVKDLAKLVAIPSISVENDGPWPFGEECKNVLDKATEIARGYGFTVVNHEYHCGSCVVPGTGEHPKRIGMFAHLDVVPLGDGWQYPPLGCTLKDGYLIGRGVGDNKGPAICALYALRFLKEHKIELKNDVMIYFGLSEETGMKDIEYFCKTQQIPDLCLVTDTNFPICYGEKGLLRAELNFQTEGNLVDFHAGSVVNVIPSKAEVLLSGVSLEEVKSQLGEQAALTVEADGPNVRITAAGVSRHAAFPEGAVNAVQVLAAALSGTTLLHGSCADAVKGLAELTSDFYGEGADIAFEDEASGKLTAVGSVVRMEEGNLKVLFDVRYSVTADGEEVSRRFGACSEKKGFSFKVTELSRPAYQPIDRPYIPLLCDICDDVLGKHYEPYTMGGGTYSRKLPVAVGFGPGVPDAVNPFESGHGQGHQPDECVPLQMLLNGLKTYIIALIELDKMM